MVEEIDLNMSFCSTYVVHLPPVTQVTPVSGWVEMMWSRDTGAPGAAWGSLANGRHPCQALRTSLRRTRRSSERYLEEEIHNK